MIKSFYGMKTFWTSPQWDVCVLTSAPKPIAPWLDMACARNAQQEYWLKHYHGVIAYGRDQPSIQAWLMGEFSLRFRLLHAERQPMCFINGEEAWTLEPIGSGGEPLLGDAAPMGQALAAIHEELKGLDRSAIRSRPDYSFAAMRRRLAELSSLSEWGTLLLSLEQAQFAWKRAFPLREEQLVLMPYGMEVFHNVRDAILLRDCSTCGSGFVEEDLAALLILLGEENACAFLSAYVSHCSGCPPTMDGLLIGAYLWELNRALLELERLPSFLQDYALPMLHNERPTVPFVRYGGIRKLLGE